MHGLVMGFLCSMDTNANASSNCRFLWHFVNVCKGIRCLCFDVNMCIIRRYDVIGMVSIWLMVEHALASAKSILWRMCVSFLHVFKMEGVYTAKDTYHAAYKYVG